MALRNYSSTAARTTLSAGVTAATTTFTVAATTGFPPAPFILAVDAGASAQELVLVTNAAGTTLTVTRGYDSTVASAHDAGAVVEHSHAAIEFREANAHVNATTNVHGLGVGSALVGTTDTQTLSGKTLALGSNTVSGTRAQFNTAMTDDDFATLAGTETLTNKTLTAPAATGSLANFGGAWTAYTPTWTGTTTNPTLGNGTIQGRYAQVGKTVAFQIRVTMGSTTTFGAGRWDFSLPVSATGFSSFSPFGIAIAADTGVRSYGGLCVYVGTSKVTGWRDVGTEAVFTPTTPFTWASGDTLELSGTYEAA